MWSSTPSRTRPRRPARPPKSKRIWAACWRRNCRRWAFATPISTSTAMSMQPSRPIPTSKCRSSASARIWTPRPIAPARTSSRRSSAITAAATSCCRAIPRQIIRAAEHPALADQIGNDIVTTDGTTLLGADNKAGLAEIMDAAHFLIRQSAHQARHHQDPVHARRRDRPRRRQGRSEKARRRFRLHDRRRNRREYRGRDVLRRRRHHHHRGRQHPSGLCQGQDGARHQDRGARSSIACRNRPARRKPPRASRAFCIRSAFPARWKRPRSA